MSGAVPIPLYPISRNLHRDAERFTDNSARAAEKVDSFQVLPEKFLFKGKNREKGAKVCDLWRGKGEEVEYISKGRGVKRKNLIGRKTSEFLTSGIRDGSRQITFLFE